MTDRIKVGEIKIEYFPTMDIIGDYFIKPLQGSLFQEFRDLILGAEEENVPMYNTKSIEWIKENKHKKSDLFNSTKVGGWEHRSVLEF